MIKLIIFQKGLQISPQIPVSAAIELISNESDQRLQKIVSALKNIENNDKSVTGAEIFNKSYIR